jgi:HEAT repeat protein
MNHRHIVALGIAGIGAAIALVIASVDRTDTRATQQPARADLQTPQRPAALFDEDAVEQPIIDESAKRDPTPQLDAQSLAADKRGVTIDAIAALMEAPEQYSESTLADMALSHAEASVREEAVHALGERRGVVALQTLQQVLQDPNPRVRAEAVRALVVVGGRDAVSILSSALSASDPSLRADVVDALGEIGGSDATQILEQMGQDENEVVREAAAEWLAELNGT